MSTIRKMHLIIIGCLLSFTIFAGTNSPVLVLSEANGLDNRWSVLASFGYSGYQQLRTNESQTGLGRLALAAEVLSIRQAIFGLELGLQSGYHLRLDVPLYTFSHYGGTLSTTIMPMFDFMVTAQANPFDESLFFTLIKGGLAYRHWHVKNPYFENKSELSGELQAGFGYPLTEISNLNLLYQGVFGGSPKMRINRYTYFGYLSNLPIQHGILVGLSIIV